MGSKSPPQTTQTNQVQLSPEQQQLFNLALPYAQQYASAPLSTYDGQTIAGFNSTEQQAQAQYKNTAAPVGTDLANRAAVAQTFMLDPAQLNPESNPYISKQADAVAGKITDQLTQKILPNIRAEGINAGGMYAGGSTRQQMAERLAGVDTVDSIGTALNNLYSTNYAAGLGNLRGAIAANPSVQAQQLFGGDVLGAVGGQERAYEQAKLDEALKQWTIQQQLPYMRSSEILSLLGGMPGATGVSTAQGATPTVSPIMGALGGAASGAAIGSAVPVIGTGIGAAVGGLAGYLGTRY